MYVLRDILKFYQRHKRETMNMLQIYRWRRLKSVFRYKF